MTPDLIQNVPKDMRQGALWHGDFEAPAGRRDAIFLALQPPTPIADRAYRIAQNIRDIHGLACPLIGPDRVHVSLLGFCGRQVMAPAAINAIRGIASTVVMPQFRIELNRAMSFGKKSDSTLNRPFVLAGDDETISGIVALRQHIISALREAGYRGHIPTSFAPHMTLFWSGPNLG